MAQKYVFFRDKETLINGLGDHTQPESNSFFYFIPQYTCLPQTSFLIHSQLLFLCLLFQWKVPLLGLSGSESSTP